MRPPTDEINARRAKIRKLETAESLAMLQQPLADLYSPSAASGRSYRDSETGRVALHVTVRRVRLVFFTILSIASVVALTFFLSGHGITIETFERNAKTIQDQEKLLEQYNSYSGTVTAALERPLATFLQLVAPVFVLRLLTTHALAVEPHKRVTVAVMAVSSGTAYLLGNGLSAVNVQVREQPVKMRITANDLKTTPDLSRTSTMSLLLAEDQEKNPMTNTLLRNLALPRTIEGHYCSGQTSMTGNDDVLYRFAQETWMKDLVPTALETKNLSLVISKSNANGAAPSKEFPMNASVAADLLLYGDSLGAWGYPAEMTFTKDTLVSDRFFRDRDPAGAKMVVPFARLMNLLPPSLNTTEEQDRAWFWTHAGPTIYNASMKDFSARNLTSVVRNWNMTLSHIDIEPDVVWVDAVTVEREMASPRLQSNDATDSMARYFEPTYHWSMGPSPIKFIQRANDSINERIDVWSVCSDSNDERNVLTTEITKNKASAGITCANASTTALFVVSYGRRLVADAVFENSSVTASKVVKNDGWSVVTNLREVVSVTVARISWKLQDLAVRYNAECDAPDGCMGLDVALPGSGGRQRLVVSDSALPIGLAPPK